MDKETKTFIIIMSSALIGLVITSVILTNILFQELKKHPIKLPAEIKIEIKKAN